MSEILDIAIKPEFAEDPVEIRKALGIDSNIPFRVLRKSIDARKRQVLIRLRCEFSKRDSLSDIRNFELKPRNVSNAREVYIVGSGPCGLFAAIRLIEAGIKPVILERGKDIRSRRRDLAALNKEHVVNPESNYCFGEGGAGTYSDGKLYTRSKKRGSVEEILQSLVAFGAPEDILIDAHPHIGTNKLPKLIEEIRKFILECGGELRFGAKLTDIRVENEQVREIVVNDNERIACSALIIATGHSARDIFHLLHNRGILIEAKSFALGVRVEHPQEIIDQLQYHCQTRSPYLSPASYSLVQQIENRGVYSFCMCPGGIIAPCATSPGEIVTNGWSPSKRNNPYANSGMVVSILPEDYDPRGTNNPLAALEYQARVEVAAFQLGGGGQTAPAQRLVDFTRKRVSSDLPKCSYQPGLRSAELRECLPLAVSKRLSEAFKAFGKSMPGYFTNEAVLVATESRTSSPVRIPRNEWMQHPQVAGLYPAGEGAGYAGGIVSAAMDGQKVADAIVIWLETAAGSQKK